MLSTRASGEVIMVLMPCSAADTVTGTELSAVLTAVSLSTPVIRKSTVVCSRPHQQESRARMVLCSPDGLLYDSSDLELYSRRIPGQQQPVEHVQELHCQQLQQK
ncbi:hypothetical protein FQN60_015197 [Etheostoma spectabile]|uniref:Uncharacterized protein n=1 Tax=Etheostoma spectabile TaxID=54343 RepID=A0A5J5CSR1_9PERO|nr:hypothetical protein FQN60_015197 [Etheostoma spectabile]